MRSFPRALVTFPKPPPTFPKFKTLEKWVGGFGKVGGVLEK